MTDEPAKTPKFDANDNPWYRLATLYGEPARDDYELHAKNRVAWNRYMAGRLTDEARAALSKAKGYPTKELMPFSPDEFEALAQEFTKRGGSPVPIPLPIVGGKISFSGIRFGE